jgi:hypothetical protein
MFWCGARKNHEKSIQEMYKWSYKMLVSNAPVVVFLARQARFWSSRHVKKNLALHFSISKSSIYLAEVPSLNSDPPCTRTYRADSNLFGDG